MKYSDLPANPSPNTVLRCEACDIDYSATRGDYWDRLHQEAKCCAAIPLDDGFVSHFTCGERLQVMQRVRSYRKVKKAS